MITARTKAIVIDLFNTLVEWEPAKLPDFEWQGQVIHSTIPLLLDHMRNCVAAWNHDEAWIQCYNAVVMEIAAERESRGVEITCLERFERSLARLPSGLQNDPGLAAELRRIHMDAVRAATFTTPACQAAVRRLASRYRLGLLSNFDDAGTGHEIIADTGVADLFEAIVISAEVALRKPNPAIFRHMLAKLELEAGEVLFVGDTPDEDVLGAQAAGIPVVWISHNRNSLPADIAPPALIVPTLADLPAALGL